MQMGNERMYSNNGRTKTRTIAKKLKPLLPPSITETIRKVVECCNYLIKHKQHTSVHQIQLSTEYKYVR